MRAGLTGVGDAAAIDDAAAILSERGLRALGELLDRALTPIGDPIEGPTVERRVRDADLEGGEAPSRGVGPAGIRATDEEIERCLEQMEFDSRSILFQAPIMSEDLRRLAIAWAERKGWRAVEAADLRPGVVDETKRWRIPRIRIQENAIEKMGMNFAIEFEIEELDPKTGDVVRRHHGFGGGESAASWWVTQVGE